MRLEAPGCVMISHTSCRGETLAEERTHFGCQVKPGPGVGGKDAASEAWRNEASGGKAAVLCGWTAARGGLRSGFHDDTLGVTVGDGTLGVTVGVTAESQAGDGQLRRTPPACPQGRLLAGVP